MVSTFFALGAVVVIAVRAGVVSLLGLRGRRRAVLQRIGGELTTDTLDRAVEILATTAG